MTSLNNVLANIRKQASRANQECDLHHGYPYKTAASRYGAICSKFEFGSETCLSFGYVFFFFGLIVMLFIYGVRRFLEEVEVAQAVPLLEGGYTQRTVAESFDVSKSVERHFQETGEFTT